MKIVYGLIRQEWKLSKWKVLYKLFWDIIRGYRNLLVTEDDAQVTQKQRMDEDGFVMILEIKYPRDRTIVTPSQRSK